MTISILITDLTKKVRGGVGEGYEQSIDLVKGA